jgi:hypothetical protein
LRFLGRAGNVSDLRGEKLSEAFVIQVFKAVFKDDVPKFALLAPNEGESSCGYTLYVEGDLRAEWADRLDEALKQNPHYAYCRTLGQLQAVRLFKISGGGYEAFVRQTANGARLGDVKPTVLSKVSGWSGVFEGTYLKTKAISGNMEIAALKSQN